jgi:hypothetical protein
LEQLGVDSAPALRGKLNINYANDWNTGYNTQTNWVATEFINRAAHAMLRASVTNMVTKEASIFKIGETIVNPDIGIAGLQHPKFPVLQNNGFSKGIQIHPIQTYSPNVHRLIQLAANIYDASRTNKFPKLNPNMPMPSLPTVMRPVFRKFRDLNNQSPSLYISHYAEVTNDWRKYARPQRFYNLTNVISSSRFPFYDGTPSTDLDVSIHGVPWIVGVKKGLPNFNEYSVDSVVKISRRLEVDKMDIANMHPSKSANWRTNQMYLLDVKNQFGVKAWNSYKQQYPGRLVMDVRYNYQIGLWDHGATNNAGGPLLITNLVSRPFREYQTIDSWGGDVKIPFTNKLNLIDNYQYSTARRRFYPNNNRDRLWESGFAVPNWRLHITNRVQYFLIDRQRDQLIDVVNLDGMVTELDITKELVGQKPSLFGRTMRAESFWITNRVNPAQGDLSPTIGITNQIEVSKGYNKISDGLWRNYSEQVRNKGTAIKGFKDFMEGRYPRSNPSNLRRMQAPFTPVLGFHKRTSWQADDPLVHYTINDLEDPYLTDSQGKNNDATLIVPTRTFDSIIQEVERNKRRYVRYNPWPTSGFDELDKEYDYRVKDPLIVDSDAWEFPEGKFPSIGWLGRVHRGTSWQTMYLKSPVISTNEWQSRRGSYGTHPTNDWRLIQLFTTAPNENAAKGLLSVNQTNAAAWSAVFSGMPVLSNSIPDNPEKYLNLSDYVRENGTEETPVIIQPSIPPNYPQYPQLDWILNGTHGLETVVINRNDERKPVLVKGLNQMRMEKGGFRNLGDILSTPTLTEFSPFLNFGRDQLATKGMPTDQQKYAIHENVMEWLPQQMLSLVKEDEPRVTVYAFGQTLKPGEQSIVTRPGQFYGMCTNYTITGEIFTKTTYRFENQWEGTNQVYRAVVEDYQVLEEQ